MAELNDRRLPVGIQSFYEIRENGYVYVDKTDLIWNLVNKGKKYNYFSRPRRFGKSVLVDTLQAYSEGEKRLFEGLRIMDLETKWIKRPVIRLDMSRAGAEADSIRSYLNNCFGEYESEYGIAPKPTDSLADRFHAIIMAAYRHTGQQVAILIDEYDSPLQHSWLTPEHDACTAVYRQVFAILKADDYYEKFVFITGITKFTQISLFSVLNNLSNISFDGQFAPLCGITQQEMTDNFMPEIEAMGKRNGWTAEETISQLKANYDGYHFSRHNMVDVFNPFSLVNALSDGEIKNYWASSGATSLLPKFVSDMEIWLKDFDNCALISPVIETSDVTGGGAELFLYQSGYLTIKGYMNGLYLLGIPNHEVRQALYETVLPALAMRRRGDILGTCKVQAPHPSDCFLHTESNGLHKVSVALFHLKNPMAMKNIYFPEEEITENDLFFVCSMIERTARQIKQRNKYVVNRIGYDNLLRQLSIADTLHSENPRQVVDDWIDEYRLENGDFDITDVDRELCTTIPTPLDMGKVYTRLIMQTRLDEEDYARGIIRVYNNDICETIDNYNCSAYYEPSYFIARSYFAGGFV